MFAVCSSRRLDSPWGSSTLSESLSETGGLSICEMRSQRRQGRRRLLLLWSLTHFATCGMSPQFFGSARRFVDKRANHGLVVSPFAHSHKRLGGVLRIVEKLFLSRANHARHYSRSTGGAVEVESILLWRK